MRLGAFDIDRKTNTFALKFRRKKKLIVNECSHTLDAGSSELAQEYITHQPSIYRNVFTTALTLFQPGAKIRLFVNFVYIS